MREKRRLVAVLTEGRRGAAMTETALLCFFLYVPILMMVIVWGDLALDKERAHMASAYMAFWPVSVDDEGLRSQFFPDAKGSPDATYAVRRVGVLTDRVGPAPRYTAVGPGALDEQMDVQAALFSMAIGEMWSSLEWTRTPAGQWELTPVVHTSRDETARYLIANQIVQAFDVPDEFQGLPGGSVSVGTGTAAARSPTEYALAVTRILNGDWVSPVGGLSPNSAPLYLSEAGLWTDYRSSFMSELAGYRHGESEYEFDVPTVAGRPAVLMKFGRYEAEPPDSSFRTGYTYLFNPDGVRGAGETRRDLWWLSDELFTFPAQQAAVAIVDMELPVSTEGDEPQYQFPTRFLEPGDPREIE